MSRQFVDDSFTNSADDALAAFKAGEDVPQSQPTYGNEDSGHAVQAGTQEWTNEMIFGETEDEEVTEEESLSNDEMPFEDAASDNDGDLEESSEEEAAEELSEETEESSPEPELPPTEVIRANGQRTVIDYDMSKPEARNKYKKAIQLAAGYKTLHGKESVLRNSLKDSDLSFLKVEDPYSKEGMKRIGLAVQGMGKLTELANSGDLDGLFRTITRSEENPNGIGIHEYVESQQQAKIDYENMSDAEKQAYDLQQELKEERKELARLRNLEDIKAQELEKQSLSVKEQERKNQVVPLFNKARIKGDEVGGNSVRANKLNKTLWSEVSSFCRAYEKETGNLPDQATLEKFIQKEKDDLIGYRTAEVKKQKTKKKVEKKVSAAQKAAQAVKTKGKPKNIGARSSIEDAIKNMFS